MKSIFFIICATVFPCSLKSQNIKLIQIINSKTKQGVPFATVKSILTKKRLSTDKNGFSEIIILENDSIFLSSVGYTELLLPVKQIQNDNIIELHENYQFLEDVIIGKSINIETKQNDLKPNFSLTANPKSKWFVATKINTPVDHNEIRLNTIKILIRKTEHKNINPVRLHLYRADKSGLLLEEEFLKKDVVLPEMENNKKYLEFQLEDQNIIINRNVDSIFYIGIEFLGFSQEKIFDGPEIKITTKSNEQNTVFKDFIEGKPDLKYEWVYISDEGFNVSKLTKVIHPWNMIVSISASVTN